MTKELTVKQEANLVVGDADFDASILADLDMKDLLISKLLLCQATSKLVQNDLAMPGQMVNSVTGELVVDKGQEEEFLIIHSYKSWFRYILKDGQPTFMGEVPYGPDNTHFPREEETPEGMIKNQIALSYFLLPKKLAHLPSTMPLVATYKMTSFITGRALVNHQAQLAAIRKNPWARAVVLSSIKKASDKNSWWITQYKPGSIVDMTSEEGQAINANAKMWRDIVKGGAVKVAAEESEVETPIVSDEF